MTHNDLTGSAQSAPRTNPAVLFIEDLIERATKTFAQLLLLFLVGGVTVMSVPWSTALQAAAIGTAATVLLALLDRSITSTNPTIEALIRAGRTFIAAFAGALPVVQDAANAPTFSSVHWGEIAAYATTAAVLSLLTSFASLPVGPAKGSPTLAPVV
ncbi:holin [Gordonia sp. WA4-43]|uniref:holin n=1 Tax=Gordonia sp. WA4-43 TaxID=2878678 RepID=UPI001CFAC1A3|nr:holin [Gordonia sp. WA4-43]UCZ88686.1 holin [Gordonia sp. WA4-43]